VSDEQLASIGGVRRNLADILTEVAEGRSTLTYMGG
jgi:ribosomal protein L29